MGRLRTPIPQSFSKMPFRVKMICFRCGGTNKVQSFGKMDWCVECAAFVRAQGGLK